MAIERVQAAVARSILRAPFRTPKTDLFKQLNWPSLHLRREIASMTLFHKLLLTRPPPLESCLLIPLCMDTQRSLHAETTPTYPARSTYQ